MIYKYNDKYINDKNEYRIGTGDRSGVTGCLLELWIYV